MRRFPLKGCEGPTGLVYAPDQRLILSARANGIAADSTPAGRQIVQLRVGPLSIIILGARPMIIGSVSMARGAKTAALAATGRIYISSAQFEALICTARPQTVKYSFEVLVIGHTK